MTEEPDRLRSARDDAKAYLDDLTKTIEEKKRATQIEVDEARAKATAIVSSAEEQKHAAAAELDRAESLRIDWEEKIAQLRNVLGGAK